jgi:hypothetical protein
MFNPSKRLGDEEDGGGRKPAVVVGIKFHPEKRLGDEDPDAADEGEAGDPDELMLKAAEGICGKLNVNTKAAPALKQYLEAFCRAADSKPHEEGDDTSDTSGEEN